MQPIDATLLPPLPMALAAAAALLLLPLGLLAYWTATAERGGERAWFAFFVRCQLFLVAIMFLDVPALLGLRLDRAAPAAGPASLVSWTLAVLLALTHLAAAVLAARRVRRRLRGATPGARATLHSWLARLSPILGLLAALVA